MFSDYASILIFALAGAAAVILGMFLGSLLRPKRPGKDGLEPYECGEKPIGSAWFRFDIRYYTVALVYIVFAVEIAFLYPWARVLREALRTKGLGGMALVEGVLFILVIAIGLAYVWRKGDLDWVRTFNPQDEDPQDAEHRESGGFR